MVDLEKTVEYLQEHDISLATAESCTAGLIVSELARVAGSGGCIDCGLAVYSPDSKNRYLKVSFDTIDQHGLTSEEVALEMAQGALTRNNASAALANTGVAGPAAGDDGTPIGRVCFAWAFRCGGNTYSFSETRDFNGGRNEVRLTAAHYALERLPKYHHDAQAQQIRKSSEEGPGSMLTEQHKNIIQALKAQPSIDVGEEIRRRVEFLSEQIKTTGQHTLVLGISGGVDSSVAGKLAQLAVEKSRQAGIADARFVAMRLPYAEQHDEDDAQAALDFIAPDEVLTVNIQTASDAMLEALESGGLSFQDASERDFNMGNIKARQRMIAQYAVAGARGGLVVGTDQAPEALTGFFTKFGDGAYDIAPLTGLTKRQVRAIGKELGGEEKLMGKVATADLETLSPGKTDEDALGVSYAEIDDFLEGEKVDDTAYDNITSRYENTQHKRQLPKEP